MVVVRTKEELQEAVKNKAASIRIEGPYASIVAQKIRSRKKKKKVAMGASALLLLGGAAAAPFTGGTSLVGAVGATALGLTIGTVTISTAELAMILGVIGGLGAFAIYKDYNIKIGAGDKYVDLSPSK